MKKLFLIFMALFFITNTVIAGDCEVKVDLLDYTPLSIATFPVVTLTGLEMKIEQPVSFAVSESPLIFFNNGKVIGFSYREAVTGSKLKPDVFYLKLFGLLPLGDDMTGIQKVRKEEGLCNSQITAIKIVNKSFMAFMRRLDNDFVNVYLIPVERKGFIHFIKFKGFSEKAVGGIITTIK